MQASMSETQRASTRRGFRPGIVAGASANDPTTVGSLAVVGATTVYGLAWLAIAILPMLAITQTIAGSVGAVAGKSLQAAIVRRFGIMLGLVALASIVAVNLLTTIADVEAGGKALAMLLPIPYAVLVILFVIIISLVLMTHSFSRVASLLTFLPVLFVAYGASAVLAHPNWLDVLRSTVIPHMQFSTIYVGGALALVGTTITSYEYLWESIEVSEAQAGARQLAGLRRDAVLGVLVAGAGFLFVIIATGATLGIHHLPIETVDDAGRALTPLAGRWAAMLFGIGLFGSAALTVPILASSTAYAVAHTFGWNGTLNAPVREAPRFYTLIIVSLVLGAAGALLGLPPIRLLFWASIAGGLGTPITLVLMNCVARSQRIMGPDRISLRLSVVGWAVTTLVTLACLAFLFSLIR